MYLGQFDGYIQRIGPLKTHDLLLVIF